MDIIGVLISYGLVIMLFASLFGIMVMLRRVSAEVAEIKKTVRGLEEQLALAPKFVDKAQAGS